MKAVIKRTVSIGFILICVGSYAAWIIFSFASALSGNGDAFQRLGSFGVFAFVLAFSKSHLVFERLEKERRRNLWDSEEEAIEMQLHGKVTEYTTAQISHYGNEQRLWRRRNIAANVELAGVAIATLQWGYGDLFVEWLCSSQR